MFIRFDEQAHSQMKRDKVRGLASYSVAEGELDLPIQLGSRGRPPLLVYFDCMGCDCHGLASANAEVWAGSQYATPGGGSP